MNLFEVSILTVYLCAGLELQIMKGTHCKASAQGHCPCYILKNALKLRGTMAKSKGNEAMVSIACSVIRTLLL